MSMAVGQRLGLRLFLEGLEVPVISAQVQIGLNAPATASIQVVPGDKILELKARTMVHLFFWDYTLDTQVATSSNTDFERMAAEQKVNIDKIQKDVAAVNAKPIDELQGYKLLFSGEVIGVVMMKTPSGRQAVLQCSDFSTYWDTTYQFFVSYSPGGNFLGTSAAVWAGSDSLFDDLTAGHTSVMNEYLHSTPQTPGLTGVKGLMGGVISLLEAMGGVPQHSHGVNDFFTIAELKNHILQQIVCEQNDDTAQRLFDEKAFMSWLGQGMSSLGQLSTFRDMMKLLFQYVYYETVPNPAAMYVPAKQSQSNTKRVTLTTRVDLNDTIRSALIDINNATLQYAGAEITDVTAVIASTYAKSIKRDVVLVADSPLMGNVYKTKLQQTYAWLDKIKDVGTSTQVINNPKTIPGNAATTTFFQNQKAWLKVVDIIDLILKQDATFSSAQDQTTKTAAELDQLHTQIFRPDCFFAAPPKCNVIFPDQYTQFQFSRNFLQETTRLRLSVDWLFGGDSGGLLAEYHFAPSTDAIAEIAKKQGNDGIRALLPWEIYSGILPKFESIHEMNYVAGQAEARRGIKGNIVGSATNYAQRTANFNYMKYRFASRTCEVSAKFNPWIVCGFPGLVIERPFIVDPQRADSVRQQVASTQTQSQSVDDMGEFVKTAAAILGAPTQYLGMIAAVGHSVQQDGASTSITMTHARTHRVTDDDFLNVFSKEISKQLLTKIVPTPLTFDTLVNKGDYKNLKLLMDATNQNLEQQAQADADSQNNVTDDEESPPIEDRPDGSPAVPSQFAGLISSPLPPPAVKVPVESYNVSPTGTYLPLRGRVKKDRLQGTRDVINVPDPGGVLTVGKSKGPNGGTIVQIQCVSDAAVGVIGKNITQRLAKGQKVTISSDNTVTQLEPDPSGVGLRLKGNVVGSGDVTYFWKSIIIYESVTANTTVELVLPVEESLRPPWFSPLYSNWFIGDEIYTPFFGCGSVVDQALFITDTGSAIFGTGRSQQQKVLDDLKAAGNDQKQFQQIIANAKANNITNVPDIESSVDVLAYIYGEIRRLGMDANKFVNDYTNRPIATMKDMFGSADLHYTQTGTTDADKKLILDTGTPGFHSTAIGDFGGQLLGLLDNPDLDLSRLKKGAGKKAPVSRDLDPRPGRRAQVVAYLADINAASGSLGVGVAG